jgi:hypothetical protein
VQCDPQSWICFLAQLLTVAVENRGAVVSAAVNRFSRELFTSDFRSWFQVACFRGTGGDGIVHTWDLRTLRCISRAVDEGCVRGTSLACSADMFATGSDAGVVNVHRREAATTGALQHMLMMYSDAGVVSV